ncbi:MAG: ROK family protein [Lachnospiraceae bacterium]
MKKSGENLKTSSLRNRGLILELIATKRCKTRIEIAKKTGLSKMTISNIISEFIEHDIVSECEEELTETCGRNPISLKISTKAPKIIGLLIFRDKLEVVLSDLSLHILHRLEYQFSEITKQELLNQICKMIDHIKTNEKILGIGIASIGPVNIKKGIVLNPPRFYGIHNLKIVEFLKDKYDYPVYLDDDNNSAALAEKLFGIGKEVSDFLFLGVSNGVGSGIISNGKVYHNAKGYASEIGHISINRDGEICSCGNKGCLELYASSNVIKNKLQQITGLKKEFSEFCRMSDDKINAVFKEMMEDIAITLVTAINLLQPELIVLGYDCIYLKDSDILYLENIVNSRKCVREGEPIKIIKSFFKDDAQVMGAAANLLVEIFQGNESILQ